MTPEQIRQPLPESLMKAIRATVASPDATAQEKLEAVVLMTHGYGLWHSSSDIKPTHYAMPEDQWGEISKLLTEASAGAEDKVNMALQWMNIGPSGYRP